MYLKQSLDMQFCVDTVIVMQYFSLAIADSYNKSLFSKEMDTSDCEDDHEVEPL